MSAVAVIDDADSPPFGLGVMFLTVLGQLDVWDAAGCRPPVYVRCSSGNNLCLDLSVGGNVWDYWFEQPCVERLRGVDATRFPSRFQLTGHYQWAPEMRDRVRAVARRHIRVQSDVVAEVDSICSGFDQSQTLAVHLRGTDKHTEAFRYGEAARVADDKIEQFVEDRIQATGLRGLYGMTDDARYAELLLDMGAIVRPIRHAEGCETNILQQRPGIQTGRDSLVDALVAARCAAYLHTPTNLASVVNAFGGFDQEFMLYPGETPERR